MTSTFNELIGVRVTSATQTVIKIQFSFANPGRFRQKILA